MKRLLSFAAAIILASTNITKAQETTTKETKGALTISGYVDTYYQYNLNNPASGLHQGRVFDTKHHNFALGLVQTMLTYTKGRARVVADLTYGPNAELGNFGNEGTARIIKQAYIAYDFSKKFSFTVGQYGTHIGYELIDAPLNYNYSLSYLFGNGPFYHTGAKLNFAASEKVGLMLGVVNGWDGLSDFNDKKSVTAQVHLSPVNGFDMYLNWVGGDEYNSLSNFGDTKGSYTSLYDFTSSYQLNDALKVGVNVAYGNFYSGTAEADPTNPWSDNAGWGGAAVYVNYATSPALGFGLRTEYFSDPEGIRYFGPLQVASVTLTGDIKLAAGNLAIKPEIRYDKSKASFFENSRGLPSKKSQATLGAAFVYSFSTE
ncbi:putative OmpL-like beta-barrel porin-2 [Pontibacter ummariensis]|uniref:Putative beta-barrel porin-2, OmpL-like. bbp2 n=1 Tax=Pontibacter ummariensis TaxID=1610492 RepID=A0A239C5E1_9BACT|nr:porin [Pontibacter ummariensis]PRY15432.1 putative OmpL-like beta-barrel porin-2 [Pontibacter ummariensis]SNS15485.1 Putative beta-barrel porin-2, OmpL-like. bbp2 [Pontibacter ummariensis]